MSYLDDLITSRANIAANIAAVTASPKPSYSVQGQSVSWGEYLAQLQDAFDKVNATIARLQGPYEVRSEAI